MNKRIVALAILLVLALFASAEGATEKASAATLKGFHATGWPVVDEPYTLTVAVQLDSQYYKDGYNALALVKKWTQDTNVQIEWVTYENAAWEEKKNLLLATAQKLPDVFLAKLGEYDILKYAPQGYWIPLEDLIDKYTVNLKGVFQMYPDVKKSLTAPDGHLYSLPRFKGQLDMKFPNRMYINVKWLQKVGKPMPESLDDFYNTLVAFKRQDPNGNGKADEIPLAFMFNEKQSNRTSTGNYRYGLYGFFGTFGRLDAPDHMIIENGKIVFTADKPEYKAAVTWLRKAMSEGLLDPEAFTMDTSGYKAKNTGADYVYGVRTGWTVEEVTKSGQEAVESYEHMPPLKNVNGKRIWPEFTYNQYQLGYFQITKDCAHPEVAIRWIDYFADPYFSLQNDWGMEGLGTKINTDGTWELMGLGHVNIRTREGMAWNAPTTVPPNIYDKMTITDPAKKQELEGAQMYLKYGVEMPPNMLMPIAEKEEMSQLEADIHPYIAKMTAKWIMEGGIDAEWDDYIKTLKRMNIDRYIKLYTDAYIRFQK